MVVGGWLAYSVLASAQGPLVLGFGTKGFGAKGLGSGLDNKLGIEKKVSRLNVESLH